MEKTLYEKCPERRGLRAHQAIASSGCEGYTGSLSRGPLERYSFDADYVRRLVEHEAETEAHFARYFGDLLRIKLRSRLRSPQRVEDACQDVFLRVLAVLRRDGGLEHPERLGAFVNVVCNNVLFEIYRENARTPAPLEGHSDVADLRQDTETALVTEDRKAHMCRVLEELSPRDRDLLRKVFLEERDKDEVCSELHVDRNHLRLLLHRARGRFRILMEKHEQPRTGSKGK